MLQDTKDHLIGGTLVALALTFFIALSKIHPALSLALAGPLFGWGVDRYQAIRRAGAFEYRDIVNTAIPFWVVAVILYFIY